jgi:iron complex outermembrane receptor protein/hemoglobin/transferrin/lactoferrin receptor protein
MKKIETIRIIACLAAALSVPTLQAQDSLTEANRLNGEDRVYFLEDYVVTGTAIALPAFEAASDISQLGGAEKLRRQAANLGETLDYLPSVSTIGTGSGVGKPVIRGLSGNRIRVLQDGIGVNYQQFGVRHPPNLDPFLAERIEVVRGASSILYGSDAFGGAINALSPEIPYAAAAGETNFDGRATYRYESGNDLHTGALNFAYAGENAGLVGAVAHRDAGNLEVPDVETWNAPPPTGQPSDIPRFDGELDHTDFDQLNTMLKGGLRFGTTEATLRFERWEHENNYLEPGGTGIGVDLENNFVQARLKGAFERDWRWDVSYSWNQNLRRANPPGQPRPVSNAAVDLERDSHTLRTEFIRGTMDDRFSGTLGFEGLYEDQESKGPAGLTPGGQVENLALFGLGRMLADPWTFEAGLRFDHRSQEADPSQTADPGLLDNRVDPVTGAPVAVDLDNDYGVMTASLGALYQVNDSFAIAANANRGFRAPDLFEMYAAGVHGGVAAVQFGDAGLTEETSLGGDLQARWRGERWDWTLTTYVTSFSGYIFLADTGAVDGGSGLPIFKVDQADATLYGGDFSASFWATDWLRLKGVYEWVRGGFDDGGDVPLLPADQLQLTAIFSQDSLGVLKNPEFRIGIRHAWSNDAAGALEPFSQFDRNPNFGTASTDAYTLLDLGVGFDYKAVSVDIGVKNATDEDYRDFLDTYKGYALSPGRNFVFQVSAGF